MLTILVKCKKIFLSDGDSTTSWPIFNDGARASFSAGDLLVLRNINEIERDAANGATLLFNEDCQDIMGVIPFMHMPETACQKLAIELARTNSMALEYAMRSLENELGLKRNYAISR